MSRLNIVNVEDPKANMYGCLPCPMCGSKYRWSTQPVHPKHPNSIICDDCGDVTPITVEEPKPH